MGSGMPKEAMKTFKIFIEAFKLRYEVDLGQWISYLLQLQIDPIILDGHDFDTYISKTIKWQKSIY